MFNAVPSLTPVRGAISSEGESENPSDAEEALKHEAALEVPSENDDEGGAESECLQMQRNQSEQTICSADKSTRI